MSKVNRIWEIDFCRGLAILFMMYFHFIVLLSDFFSYNIDYFSGFNFLTSRIAQVLFITTAGISSTFSRSNLKRGIKVFGLGMLITAATYIAFPLSYIKFGILHFLGISMIIYHFTRKLPSFIYVVFSLGSFALGSYLSTMVTDLTYLYPLGLIYKGFTSLDYFPLFPWIGLYFTGVYLGKVFYKERKSIFPIQPRPGFLAYISRHSLMLYLIHQPIFYITLYVIHHFK